MSSPPGLFRFEGFWPLSGGSSENSDATPLTSAKYIEICELWARHALTKEKIVENPTNAQTAGELAASLPEGSRGSIAAGLLCRTYLARLALINAEGHGYEGPDVKRSWESRATQDQRRAQWRKDQSKVLHSLAMTFVDLTYFLTLVISAVGIPETGSLTEMAQQAKQTAERRRAGAQQRNQDASSVRDRRKTTAIEIAKQQISSGLTEGGAKWTVSLLAQRVIDNWHDEKECQQYPTVYKYLQEALKEGRLELP